MMMMNGIVIFDGWKSQMDVAMAMAMTMMMTEEMVDLDDRSQVLMPVLLLLLPPRHRLLGTG